ncbi:MAG: acyl-CoA thioesterase [Cystobacterineae bacterium]|nr:acyl-CoA thioesterase [Cystobacterineae bacterium]MCL2258943.1 acyl-CoA thioesterase [Cystobacterineae bacterium]
MAFESKLYIRFHHVDFAQVVYFPKFFDYCHQVFEDFVQAEFSKSYRCLMEEEGVGFPVVHAEADFRKPFSFGDTARVVLEIESLGRTSLRCRYAFFHPGEEESAAVVTLVGACVGMQGFRPTPIPERWRNMLGRHLQNPPNLL